MPLPGRISIRPLSQYVNRPGTHKVALHETKMELDIKYPYQTLRNKVEYNNISQINVKMDDVQGSPLTRNVSILTKTRQLYEIPDMDITKANKLKEEIETQQLLTQRDQTVVDKKRSADRTLSFSRYRR